LPLVNPKLPRSRTYLSLLKPPPERVYRAVSLTRDPELSPIRSRSPTAGPRSAIASEFRGTTTPVAPEFDIRGRINVEGLIASPPDRGVACAATALSAGGVPRVRGELLLAGSETRSPLPLDRV